MSKFKNLIQEARKPESQTSVNTENEISAPDDGVANLTIKIPIKLRRHWMSKAKAQGLTLTRVITDALTEKFGNP